MNLTEEQAKAASLQPEGVRLTDPGTNREYVLVRAEVYDRLKELLNDDSSWTDEQKDALHKLVDEWKSDRRPTSSAVKMATHPAYQRIIAMGKTNPDKVVPVLLAELERSPDHWFIALHAITGADPVPVTSRGKVREMAAAWTRWWEAQDGEKREREDRGVVPKPRAS